MFFVSKNTKHKESGYIMDKYIRMKNPPRFSGEWKFFAFFFFDLLTIGGCLFWAKMVNHFAHLSMLFAFFNYLLWFSIGLAIVWRPYNHPGQRQLFMVIEAIFFADKNHYHAFDPNRNYHGTFKEDE